MRDVVFMTSPSRRLRGGGWMQDDILNDQLTYYRARASEYDESLQGRRRFLGDEASTTIQQELARVRQALHDLGRFDEVLELACGTGTWTRELLRVGTRITALDGSPEMLAIARANVDNAAVEFLCADIFAWKPTTQFDLVMFAGWISHVPPDRLDGFLDKVRDAVRPGGRVFLVDEPAGGREFSGAVEAGMYQTRSIRDGRAFRIIKVYYDPLVLRDTLEQHGFDSATADAGEYFFHVTGSRSRI